MPCHQPKKIVPSSVDILQLKKKQLLKEHQEVIKSVERLASQQRDQDQKVSLPLIKPPRHVVHQSVDSLSQPLLCRLQNNQQQEVSDEKPKVNHLVNLRYKNRVNNDDDELPS